MMVALSVQFLIVLLMMYSLFLFWKQGQKLEHPRPFSFFFIFFTSDSNLLMAFGSAVAIPCICRLIAHGGTLLPIWVSALRFVGTVAVLVTFTTVMTFLAPIAGYREMLTGSDLILHLILPLLSLFSFVFLEPHGEIPFCFTFLGLLPTLLYGVAYLIQVVVIGEENGGWKDYYTFNKNGKWRISCILMLAGTYLLSLLLFFLCKLPAMN